uniref:Uncharacterized protein n=1 Tax=Cannabis sativa TaxID=3483 RepID=A0A803Q074_CANSA
MRSILVFLAMQGGDENKKKLQLCTWEKLYWHKSNGGLYFIRSGYWNTIRILGFGQGSSSNGFGHLLWGLACLSSWLSEGGGRVRFPYEAFGMRFDLMGMEM